MVVVSSTFSPPTEGVLLHQPSTKLLVNDKELGTASLYITESNVVWGGGVLATGTAAPTLTFQYPTISLHGVQKDPTSALFMVINYELRLPELGNAASGDAEQNEDDEYDPAEEPVTQLRFIPPSEDNLQLMYSAMCQGQALHPDPADEVEDDDDNYMDGEDFEDDDMFEDAEEIQQSEEAAARLRQLRIENSNGHCEDGSDNAED